MRCAWGLCNVDSRYPERCVSVKFIPFPKPYADRDKCLRWIKLCGRPHHQLNKNKIDRNRYVCSKHFFGGSGPTEEFPDPQPADGSTPIKSRKILKRRLMMDQSEGASNMMVQHANCDDDDDDDGERVQVACTQTDMLSVTMMVKSYESEIQKKDATIQELKKKLEEKEQLHKEHKFGVASTLIKENKIKGLFQCMTGLPHTKFLVLLDFLLSDSPVIKYDANRSDINMLNDKDHLFLTLCRIRQNLDLRDLAGRFGISIQAAGSIFNAWIELMYLKFGQISIWPHRDTIIEHMPEGYKKDFPTSITIIDGTELKTERPSYLPLQSQLYSDYKSTNTLKSLVGCDPSGALMFVSELFTGSISDKELTERSGFYKVIQDLKAFGYIKDGDAVMADKGFTIGEELQILGLHLNIPPFASSCSQMTPTETTLTLKIAKHRVHVERLIAKIKCFKIISSKIPATLFKNVNKIWTVCSFLTLFQEGYLK